MNEELSPGFEKDLGTLLVGVDTLWGGNIQGPAAERFILDHWISGRKLPSIYHDPLAQELRTKKGVLGEVSKDAVRTFSRRYDLWELPNAVWQSARPFEHFRRRYVENLVEALEMILYTALAVHGLHSSLSFDERRRAVTKENEILLVPVKPLQEQLRAALDRAGVNSTERTVRDRYLAWKNQRIILPEKIEREVSHIKEELFEHLKTTFFEQYADSFTNHLQLSDLTLTGHNFQLTTNKPYTGFNQYDGGEDEAGRPLLKGLFELNVDHPVTKEDLYHLVTHEVLAHYFSCVLRDVGYRSGQHSIESAMGTMCTPQAALEEGLAETMIFLLYGSREAVIEKFGSGMGVVLAANDLENAAKYNVGILHLREGKSIDYVKAYVAEQCLLEDALVEKMSRAWAGHPIFAPMYGPAYHYGTKIVRAAADRCDPDHVVRWGLHLDGLLDIHTFNEKAQNSSRLNTYKERALSKK